MFQLFRTEFRKCRYQVSGHKMEIYIKQMSGFEFHIHMFEFRLYWKYAIRSKFDGPKGPKWTVICMKVGVKRSYGMTHTLEFHYEKLEHCKYIELLFFYFVQLLADKACHRPW